MNTRTNQRILILYGSQTGQAQAISEEIYDHLARGHQLEVLREQDGQFGGIGVDRLPLSAIDDNGGNGVGHQFQLETEHTVIFVVSTTGEGEPPEQAVKFFRRYRRRTHPRGLLGHLSYTVLALGDTNYERFANFGKDLDKRLHQLSAKRFYDTGFGDDAVGLELGVEPWIDNLFGALLKHFNAYTTVSIPTVVEVKVLPVIVDQLSGNMSTIENLPIMVTEDPKLSQLTELTLPLISSKSLAFQVKLWETLPEKYQPKEFPFPLLPVMDSQITDSTIVSMRQLSASNDDDSDVVTDYKTILEATVRLDDNSSDVIAYEAGDSFGFIIGNYDEEVDQLIDYCLDLQSDKRDYYCQILTTELFPHLPSISKVKDLLKYYLELRSVPKKSFLRHLADFCSDLAHKRRLLELSSREGSDDYNKYIRNNFVNILDILRLFDSCRPPLAVLLANIACHTPRYYSVCNGPDPENRNQFKIAFSVTEFQPRNQRKDSQLLGVFTGQLSRLFNRRQKSSTVDIGGGDIADQLTKLSLESDLRCLKVFKRKNPYFKLPATVSTPIIMIGSGTGVAPFVGFLEQRQLVGRTQRSAIPSGECWLLYGCRYRRKDYIYGDQLKQFVDDRVLTQLCVCFSRDVTPTTITDGGNGGGGGDEESPKYVQNLIQKYGQSLYKLIDTKRAIVYVCGDLKGMSIDVYNAFVAIVEQNGHKSREDSVKYVRQLQSDRRYLQDIWT
ncbi:methionine synthase reductase-like [Oppia nitens]|uniref:methionine synthase reductase-like n=1 Tax=Oppia nitens TaxID=1686743 RepID=UPI0023DAE3B8|nr:methionine synthase reductase-like [Oppia nitens]